MWIKLVVFSEVSVNRLNAYDVCSDVEGVVCAGVRNKRLS